MADFEEALNSLLADPDAMGQIMSLAGKLGMAVSYTHLTLPTIA